MQGRCPAVTAGGGYIFRCPLEAGHIGEHRYAEAVPLFNQSPVVTGETNEQSTAQA